MRFSSSNLTKAKLTLDYITSNSFRNEYKCEKPSLWQASEITPKMDLLIRYLENKEPTFLRKLKNEHGNYDLGRPEHSIPRPRKQRLQDDDDDGPTYLCEESHETMSKKDFIALLDPPECKNSKEETTLLSTGQSKLAEDHPRLKIEHDEGISLKEPKLSIGQNVKKRSAKAIGDGSGISVSADENVSSSKFKKKKRIKLSFDEITEP